jgi:bifunctional enzyme CysN/CysC
VKIDPHSHERIAENIVTVTGDDRARLKAQSACCIWLTGLSGSGKSTLAYSLDAYLHGKGKHTYVLDGDVVRRGLNSGLSFADADRRENVRRIGEVAKLMVDAGLIVIVSCIAPRQEYRDNVRQLLPAGCFNEVFVNAPVEVCIARDPKGLYARSSQGHLAGLTGVSSLYESPRSPELELRTDIMTVSQCVRKLASLVI